MIAVIMAGGKASRFKNHVEKGILEVGGRPLLERSAGALRAESVRNIVVTVTRYTPETKRLARRLDIETVETSGMSYHDDTIELMDRFDKFLSLNVDVPFVSKQHVESLIDRCSDKSLAAVVPASLALRTPVEASLLKDELGTTMIWAGFNFVTMNPDTQLVKYEDPLLTLNINTEEELEFANRIARERNL